jgi:hypothetical protein
VLQAALSIAGCKYSMSPLHNATTTFAIISILRQTLFPFDSQMMMMLEVMVIGIGSFALSMEANRKKVSGKFVSYIFSHSIPGACILILNILVYELIGPAIAKICLKKAGEIKES